MRQPIRATDTAAEGERVATYPSRRAAEQAVEQLAADPDLTSSVWIQVSKLDSPDRDSQQGSGHEGIPRADLAAAFGVGALLGIVFLVLTLIGLSVLAWAVLGLVMTWALADTALVAVGSSRLTILGRWRAWSRRQACSYAVIADPAIADQVARVLLTGPHRRWG